MTMPGSSSGSARPALWLRLLTGLVLVAALGNVALFVTLAALRLSYPFDLEWVEGGHVDEILRIAQGQPVYGEPSISFLPFAYAPLFFYISAAVTKVMGAGYAAPRLVSLISTLGCFILLFSAAARESRSPVPGIVAAGLYAAAYRFTGAWMDLVKTDSLFLLLVLAAFLVGQRSRGRAGMLLSGCLFVAAYYTKQMTLPIALVLAPISLLATRGRTWLQWASAGALGLLIFVGADRATDGWFSYYSFDIMTYHERVDDFWLFWRLLLPRMWPALVLGLLFPIWELQQRRLAGKWPSTRLLHYGGFCLALILASWSVFQKVWTYANGLMPAVLGLALMAGLGLGRVLQIDPARRRRPACYVALAGSLCLVIAQFVLLVYNPLEQLPSLEDRLAGEELVDRLSELPGEVLIYDRGYLARLAGKQPTLHSVAYGDVVGPRQPPRNEDHLRRKELVRKTFRSAITEQRFDWVVSAERQASWLPYYVHVDSLFTEPDVFFPVTGARSRPESLMIRNPVARGGTLPMSNPLYDPLLFDGWRAAESWGRWTEGARSNVAIALESGHDYRLEIGLVNPCAPQAEAMIVKVSWNSILLGQSSLQACGASSLSYELPSAQLAEDLNSLWLEIEAGIGSREPEQPAPADPPAIGVVQISFEQR